MSLFRKIFGSKSDKTAEELKSNDRGKYMPEIKLPIDERFTINFKANGGKFLYCENLNEVLENLQHIIQENSWEEKKTLLLDNNLEDKFKSSNLNACHRRRPRPTKNESELGGPQAAGSQARGRGEQPRPESLRFLQETDRGPRCRYYRVLHCEAQVPDHRRHPGHDAHPAPAAGGRRQAGGVRLPAEVHRR